MDICLMLVLVVSATALEIAPFITQHIHGKYAPLEIKMSETGVGLVSATYRICQQALILKPDVIIQAGTAGSFVEAYEPGTTLFVKRDRVADEGVREDNRFKNLFDMGLAQTDKAPFSGGWLENGHTKYFSLPGFEWVDAISVNEITTDPERLGEIRESLHPALESMEGAALHYVCGMENIPFLQIRTISNQVGERNKKAWKMKDAIARLNLDLNRVLEFIQQRSKEESK